MKELSKPSQNDSQQLRSTPSYIQAADECIVLPRVNYGLQFVWQFSGNFHELI